MKPHSSEVPLPSTIAIIGLGLIGGSMARDLLARRVRVLAFDRDAATLRAAAQQGVVPLGELSSPELREAELVVLGVPVTAAVELLPRLVAHLSADCVLTDVGSTKRSIVAAAEDAGIEDRFVGSHPVAGDHRSGWGAAREGLFHGAQVFLTTAPGTAAPAFERVESLWRALGARVQPIDPASHDLRFAWTSHLPQVAASSLAVALDSAGWRIDQLGPGGRDATRLAGSSPEIWTAIALDNAGALLPAVEALADYLLAFAEALKKRDAATIDDFFATGRSWSQGSPPE